MKTADFFVFGSEGDIYQINFSQITGGVKVTCNCQAGQTGMFCRHRLQLLAGDFSELQDQSKIEELNEVLNWEEFNEIKKNMTELYEVEKKIAELDRIKTKLKKLVAASIGIKKKEK
jgi:hypothetical protein